MADDQERAFDMRKARELWAGKGGNIGKASRKARRSKLVGSVDKRSLRRTNRTEQFNFRCIAGLKGQAQEAADMAGVPLAEWMQLAVEAYLAKPMQSEPKQEASDA
jgi:hypothetical protein